MTHDNVTSHLSSAEVCLVCGLEFWLTRVEEVLQDAADGLEDVAGGDAVLVLDVPLPQQPHTLLHVEGLETLHHSGSLEVQDSDFSDVSYNATEVPMKNRFFSLEVPLVIPYQHNEKLKCKGIILLSFGYVVMA